MSTLETSPKSKPIRRWLVWIVASAGTLILLGLSYWQYSKIAPKDAEIALVEARMALPPIPLPNNIADLDDWLYRMVSVQGRYIPQGVRHVYRAGPKGGAGYHLLVPFARMSAPAIWVDLGWMPVLQKAAYEAPVLPAGITAVIAQVHPRQRSAKIVEALAPDRPGNIYYRLQPEVLGADMQLDAITQVYLISPLPLEGLLAAPPPVKLEHNHRSYAFQWLAMALGLVAVTGVFLRR